MREPSPQEETAYSVPSTAKKGFNGLSFRWLGIAAVIVLLGILFILFKQPKPGVASPPSHTSHLMAPGANLAGAGPAVAVRVSAA